uniref:SCP domain-containing protein n=1 Tax=Strongyloides papillosus TaxID=174720 RepID=A0A0N5C163_STREA
MHIFYNSNYITIIILSILFYQYQAIETNVKSDDSESLNLLQNDLISKSDIKQDSMVSSLTENGELNYFQKRQANLKSRQKKSKKTNSRTTSRLKITTKKKPLSGKISPRKTTPRKTTPRKATPRKSTPRKTTPRKAKPVKTTSRRTTTRKTSFKKTTKNPAILKTTRKMSSSNKSTTKKPTTTTKKRQISKVTKPSPIKPIIVQSTTRTPTTTTSVTTTEKPDDLSKYIKKTIDDINKLREKFNRKPLIVKDELVKEAKNYSDYFVNDVEDLEEYKDEGRLQYLCSIKDLDKFDAVKFWASNYDDKIIDKSEEKFEFPEFAQIIAKKSTDIGCAIKKAELFVGLFCRIQPTVDLGHEDYVEDENSKKTTSRLKITTKKKPLSGKISPRKTTPRKTTPRKATPRKSTPRKTTPRKAKPVKTTSRRTTTRKTSFKKTTKNPAILKTTRKMSSSNKSTTKKPTTTTKKRQISKVTKPSPIKPIIVQSTTRTPTTTTSVTTTEKPDDLSKYIKKTIDDINKLREKFNRKPLIVKDELVKEAKNYSDYFVNDVEDLEEYKDEGRLQYLCSIKDLDKFDAVKFWASNYDDKIIDKSEEKFEFPEFAQIIAKKSTDIGCAIKKAELFVGLFCRIQPTVDLGHEDYVEDENSKK